jgi:hypothetical protein
MIRPALRVALIASASAVVLAIWPIAAQSAGPIHTNFTVSGTTSLCGLTVGQTGRGVDNFSPAFDSTGRLIAFTDAYEFTVQFSYNGKAIDLDAAGTMVGRMVFNSDGSTVSTVSATGMPEKWSLPDGSTITLDAGIVVLREVTAANGTIIDTVPREVGPHPEVDSNFALICQVVLSVLT